MIMMMIMWLCIGPADWDAGRGTVLVAEQDTWYLFVYEPGRNVKTQEAEGGRLIGLRYM